MEPLLGPKKPKRRAAAKPRNPLALPTRKLGQKVKPPAKGIKAPYKRGKPSIDDD